jgi:hypothetical protein
VPGSKMVQTIPLILISTRHGRTQRLTRAAVSPTGRRGQGV